MPNKRRKSSKIPLFHHGKTSTSRKRRLTVRPRGRPCITATPAVVRRVKALFRKTPGISVRVAAKRLKIPRSVFSDIKVRKLGITARTKKKAPHYVKDQEARAKKGLRYVYRKSLHKILIIDDESYVPLDPSQVPGRKFSHAVDHSQLGFKDKFKTVTKFTKKFLVWQAMDENGHVSESYISSGTMTSQVYLKECIQGRLIPFINKHYKMSDIFFWPDLATCHYAKTVIEYMKSKNIEMCPRSKNPPNVPQAREIESFWSLCKSQYSERKIQPKKLLGFSKVWRNISTNVAKKSGKACLDNASTYIRAIGYKGLPRAMLDLSNKSKR